MNETIRAAWVIARRDFAAIIFSRAFFFFLLGPIFPLAIGIAAGGIGGQVARDIDRTLVAVTMEAGDVAALEEAHQALAAQLGERRLPALAALPDSTASADDLLAGSEDAQSYAAVLTGSLARPELIGPPGEIARWGGEISLLIGTARAGANEPVTLETREVSDSEGAREQARLVTAQIGQFLLVLLTMLLAGMVLSNLVEEKTNKIIEILTAAIPIDAIFIGKLLAMLAMAMVGIAAWSVLCFVAITLFGPGMPSLPEPATGWPAFIALTLVYFAMAYLLLGSVFLGIGAMATTVREVQTLSMPATMAQLLVFFLAAYSITRLGEPIEIAAVVIPFSSPFAMLARAAQQDILWTHFVAIGWQLLWTLLIIQISVRFFRRNVMKSGGGGRNADGTKRRFWQLRRS